MADNKDGEENTSHGNEHKFSEMSDNKDGEEAVPRGSEWEVVSLTASTYAAAPGPRGDESIHEENDLTASKDSEAETSNALFMSGHFVFPPSQHENLPIEPEKCDTSRVEENEPAGGTVVAEEGKAEQKEEENWRIEELNVSEEFPGIPLLEQKGDEMLIHGSGLNESTTLHEVDVDHKEEDVYGTATFSSFHSAPDVSGPEAFGESIDVRELLQPSDEGICPLPPFLTKPSRSEKDDEVDDSDLPCGAWWKRRVVSLYAHVKDTSSFWSIFVAAAVMGLVILGQHWQQERWQVLQRRWHLSVGDEKSGRILSRLKDVIVGGTRHSTYISAASADR